MRKKYKYDLSGTLALLTAITPAFMIFLCTQYCDRHGNDIPTKEQFATTAPVPTQKKDTSAKNVPAKWPTEVMLQGSNSR